MQTIYVRELREYALASDCITLRVDLLENRPDGAQYAVAKKLPALSHGAEELLLAFAEIVKVWRSIECPRTKRMPIPKGAIGRGWALVIDRGMLASVEPVDGIE